MTTGPAVTCKQSTHLSVLCSMQTDFLHVRNSVESSSYVVFVCICSTKDWMLTDAKVDINTFHKVRSCYYCCYYCCCFFTIVVIIVYCCYFHLHFIFTLVNILWIIQLILSVALLFFFT